MLIAGIERRTTAAVMKSRVAWHRSLSFRASMAALLAAGWISAGIYLVMDREAKPHLEQEAHRLVEQMGNNVVTGLDARLREIAALTRSLNTSAHVLPRDEPHFKSDLPRIIDFGGDT